MKNKEMAGGFTLIEILTAIVIGFIILSLIYQTFKTTARTIVSVEASINDFQKDISFFYDFSRRISNINADSEKNKFSSDSITVEIFDNVSQKIITYDVEQNIHGKEDLICSESDETFQTEFSYPCLTDKDDIYFTFSYGDQWSENLEEGNMPSGIALNVKNGNEEIFYPVLLQVSAPKQSL